MHRGAGQQLRRRPGQLIPHPPVNRISIVVPVLNEAPRLAEHLEHLQEMRAQGHELIVVDGGSEDASLSVARPLVDRLLITGPGRAQQMNEGADRASGEILLFLHADTRLPDGAADLIQQAMAAAPWAWFDVRLDNPAWPYRVIAAGMNLRARLTRVCTGDQALLVRHDLFGAIRGFPAIPLMEDVAISKRLRARARPRVIAAPVLTSSRRWERQGVFSTVLFMWKLRLLYFLGVAPERLVKQYYPAP